jgi:hypothetical protein
MGLFGMPLSSVSAKREGQAELIRQALAEVDGWRGLCADDAERMSRVRTIKRFQSARFAHVYADVLGSARWGSAAKFFLTELYSERDYTKRDAQFAKIAGTIERLFPQKVVATATMLAQVHALSEGLDQRMAEHLETLPIAALDYVQAWQATAQRDARMRQLQTVLQLGAQLRSLTRTPGLRSMLKVMRGPAAAAGLGALQTFIEAGFDTFAGMTDPDGFLKTIEERESRYIDFLFAAGPAEAQHDAALEVAAMQSAKL